MLLNRIPRTKSITWFQLCWLGSLGSLLGWEGLRTQCVRAPGLGPLLCCPWWEAGKWWTSCLLCMLKCSLSLPRSPPCSTLPAKLKVSLQTHWKNKAHVALFAEEWKSGLHRHLTEGYIFLHKNVSPHTPNPLMPWRLCLEPGAGEVLGMVSRIGNPVLSLEGASSASWGRSQWREGLLRLRQEEKGMQWGPHLDQGGDWVQRAWV